ncbi:MAG: methionine adenosyltransferase [Holosporales bacterium]|jgi:S-adenosylmethionine synthetase
MSSFVFTSESVSEGHPDKICDQISDAVLDTFLAADPQARVACETLATTGRVVLAGEVRGPDAITPDVIEQVVRQTVKKIGYEQRGFHWKNLVVENYLHEQSQDIAVGVDETNDKAEGAGDQGIMFGYACKETPDYMPAPIYYAHQILRALSEARHSGAIKGLGPDAKSQVSLLYENEKPVRTTSIVVSHQHDEALSAKEVHEIVRHYVGQVMPKGWLCPEEKFYINPTGRFVIGGPDGDAGLTGRKIIVDTYGGAAPHGGGAFSGKDPTKVDRSAAYAARYLAKNIVAAGLAERCTLQLSYAIGVAEPLSVYLNFHDTSKVSEAHVAGALRRFMDLTPKGIRQHLQLNRPIYQVAASYGHFGRAPQENGAFSWEKLDLVAKLQEAFL